MKYIKTLTYSYCILYDVFYICSTMTIGTQSNVVSLKEKNMGCILVTSVNHTYGKICNIHAIPPCYDYFTIQFYSWASHFFIGLQYIRELFSYDTNLLSTIIYSQTYLTHAPQYGMSSYEPFHTEILYMHSYKYILYTYTVYTVYTVSIKNVMPYYFLSIISIRIFQYS